VVLILRSGFDSLRTRGVDVSTEADLALVEAMKRRVCRVAFSSSSSSSVSSASSIAAAMAAEIASSADAPLALPDGSVVHLGSAAVDLPAEVPSVLASLAHSVIINVDSQLRDTLVKQCVLSGGNTLFPGAPHLFRRILISSLEAENANRIATAKAPTEPRDTLQNDHGSTDGASNAALCSTDVNVVAQSARQAQSWLGGSILASLSTFPLLCHAKRDYDETGSSILYRK